MGWMEKEGEGKKETGSGGWGIGDQDGVTTEKNSVQGQS